MSSERLAAIFLAAVVLAFVSFFGFAMFEEACDVGDNWTCGIADDGFHDGTFNWRHGVFPW